MTLLKQHLNSMGASGNLSNVWQKNIHGVSDMQEVHVCFKSGKDMTSLSCCIDFRDDLMYGLGFMDHVELFGV